MVADIEFSLSSYYPDSCLIALRYDNGVELIAYD
jgi:hypothetical protein